VKQSTTSHNPSQLISKMFNYTAKRQLVDNYKAVMEAHKKVAKAFVVDDELGVSMGRHYDAENQMNAYPVAEKMDGITDTKNRLAVHLAGGLKSRVEKVHVLVGWIFNKYGEPGISLLADQWPGFTARDETQMFFKLSNYLDKIPDPVLANDPMPAPDAAPKDDSLGSEQLFQEPAPTVNVVEPEPTAEYQAPNQTPYNFKVHNKRTDRENKKYDAQKAQYEQSKKIAAEKKAAGDEKRRQKALAEKYQDAFDDMK